MKNQLEKEYEARIKSAIKQVETSINRQLERSVVEKFHLKHIKELRIFWSIGSILSCTRQNWY